MGTSLDATGLPVGEEQRMQQLLEAAALADSVGLDVFGIGEHHRPDYIASSPTVVLAAIAAQTKHIRLTSAVTVLSSDDPVRFFQRSLWSHGCSSFIESGGSGKRGLAIKSKLSRNKPGQCCSAARPASSQAPQRPSYLKLGRPLPTSH